MPLQLPTGQVQPELQTWIEQTVRAFGILEDRLGKLENKKIVKPQLQADPQPSSLSYTVSTNTALNASDLGMTHYINCTSDSNLTLPVTYELGWIEVFNYGSSVLTIKNSGGTAIGSLMQYQYTRIIAFPNSSGVPAWPSKIIVFGSSGSVKLEGDLSFKSSSSGVILKDTAGTPHYWRVSTSAAGVLSTADLGTTDASDTSPS